MANAVTLAKTLVDGVDWPNATDTNANNNKLNDRIYVSTAAPSTPYEGQIWFKTDEDATIALRIYKGTSWFAIPLAVIE